MEAERIQMIRGILQVVGIIVVLIAAIMLYKNGHAVKPCYYRHPNGTIEDTGLYGNCTWINQYIAVKCTDLEKEAAFEWIQPL